MKTLLIGPVYDPGFFTLAGNAHFNILRNQFFHIKDYTLLYKKSAEALYSVITCGFTSAS